MKVVVLLATYNGDGYVYDQIDSILKQNDVEVDIIISDDSSKDKTLEIISDGFPLLKTSVNYPGTGSAARNFLNMISELDCKKDFQYVAFSDQDDIWLPNKLISAITALRDKQSSLYCSNLTKWETNNGSFKLLKKDYPQKKFDFLFEGGSAGCTYVFTREFAYELQLFLLKLNISDWKELSHDWLIYFFARLNQYKVVIDGNSYIHYRLHNANVHGHLNKLSLNTIKEKSSEVFKGYYQKQIANYMKYLDPKSEEYSIYEKFMKGYISRNLMIWRYNTVLMRDKKKFLIFAILNLLKFN